jgi:hypothetical protein
MATTAVTGLRQVTFALRQHGEDMDQEMASELDVLAQIAARRMGALAAKWRSLLVASIGVSAPEPLVREIGPNVDYARYVEEGQKPGKSLPRYLDPAAKGIVDWLQSKAFAGKGRARKNTMAAVHRNLELRDRYEGLAWSVRHKGIRAQPFVEPTAREMAELMPRRLDLAVRRVLARRDAAGGASA